MVRTRVGYAGDPRKDDPSYHDLGGHAEAIQIDFDPSVLAYADLLDLFGEIHNPTWPAWSPQYRSALFFAGEGQREAAMAWCERFERVSGGRVRTEFAPLDRFWVAEDYHQKYRLLGNRALREEYRLVFPDFRDFRDSTAVARVNGCLDGFGAPGQLEEALPLLGLSEAGQAELRRRA